MNIIFLLLVGVAIAGLADYLDSKTVKGGVMSALLLGGAGALFGGIAANIIFGQQILSANLATVLLSCVGALLIILIHRTAGAR